MINFVEKISVAFLVSLFLACSAYAGDRIEVACPKYSTVILAFGQSNSANYAPDLRNPKNKKLLNFFEGHCYIALDPLLGPSGDRGSVWTALGELFVARGETVILVPIGVGNTFVSDWGEGYLNPKLKNTLAQLKIAKLYPTYILWHQGEKDANRNTKDYASQFAKIVISIRSSGVDAPIYVAVATLCKGSPNELIRNAQLSLPTIYKNVRLGPDTDALGSEYRPDGCHILAEPHARLWFDAINLIGDPPAFPGR